MEVSFDLVQYMNLHNLELKDIYDLKVTGYSELDKELSIIQKYKPKELRSSVTATMLMDCFGAYKRKDYESYYILARALAFKKLSCVSKHLNELGRLFATNIFGIAPLQVRYEKTGKYLNNSYNKVCDENGKLLEMTDFGIYLQNKLYNTLKEKHRYALGDNIYIVENGNVLGEPYLLKHQFYGEFITDRPVIHSDCLRFFRVNELKDLGEDLTYNFFSEEEFIDLLFSLDKNNFTSEITTLIKNKNLNTFYFKYNPPHFSKFIEAKHSLKPVTLFSLLSQFVSMISDRDKSVQDFLLNKELTSSVILQALNIYLM